MNVMVTGSAGYIGSHATAALLRAGHSVVGVDNLFRGHRRAMELCKVIAPDRLVFHEGDINDTARLTVWLREHHVDAVLHFAAMAYVGESVDQPLRYYKANTAGTVSLLEACAATGVGRLVFSSSCSTYGDVPSERVPVAEDAPQDPQSPYARSKAQCEQVIADFAQERRRAGKPFDWRALRYFNVAGCDVTGVLGEDHEPETHLIPNVLRAAAGRLEAVDLFGTDYPTPDGTCVRDYIHVGDLAEAHLAALASLNPAAPSAERVPAYNLGIGKGYSVKQIIQAAERVTGRKIPVRIKPRRAGDVAQVYANPAKIGRDLGWKAKVTDLDDIIASAWRWFEKHPTGYR